jgi:hypothetical protein
MSSLRRCGQRPAERGRKQRLPGWQQIGEHGLRKTNDSDFIEVQTEPILAIWDSMKTLSEQLRNAIVKSGVSRYEISKRTGVSQAALSKFVLGHRGISVKAMDAVGLFLGLSITPKKGR